MIESFESNGDGAGASLSVHQDDGLDDAVPRFGDRDAADLNDRADGGKSFHSPGAFGEDHSFHEYSVDVFRDPSGQLTEFARAGDHFDDTAREIDEEWFWIWELVTARRLLAEEVVWPEPIGVGVGGLARVRRVWLRSAVR